MKSASVVQDEIIYPASDGKPMAETPEHILLMIELISGLRQHFKRRRNIYVIGNIFLYYQEGDPAAKRSPDIMMVKGVNPKAKRRSFKIWVEGAVPSAILELTSKKTAKEDQEIKFPLYEKLGVQEYFLFDPLNDYLPRQLMGYTLVNQRYQELTPDDQGGLISKELGLRLVPNGADLVLIDIKTGERLLNLDEMSELKEEFRLRADRETRRARKQRKLAENEKEHAGQQKQRADEAAQRAEQEKQRAEQEKQRAEQEKQRAEQEKQRAEQEKQRADALAAEVARLRAQLKQPPT